MFIGNIVICTESREQVDESGKVDVCTGEKREEISVEARQNLCM